jgi:hypothetical protein
MIRHKPIEKFCSHSVLNGGSGLLIMYGNEKQTNTVRVFMKVVDGKVKEGNFRGPKTERARRTGNLDKTYRKQCLQENRSLTSGMRDLLSPPSTLAPLTCLMELCP